MTECFAPFDINGIRLSLETTVSRSIRVNKAQFGDGYQQTTVDGLNSYQEIYSCRTVPISSEEAWGLEAFIFKSRGVPFLWTPPDSTKSFLSTFTDSELDLGYRNLDSVFIKGYESPDDYTVSLSKGVLTSVTIEDSYPVYITLTLSPNYYELGSTWSVSNVTPSLYVFSFELRRVYI